MRIYLVLACSLCINFMSTAQTITQLEYFLDTDAGFGKNTLVNVTPTEDGSFPLNLNIGNAATGYHKLYIRTKDSEGNWSHTTRRTIEVLGSVAKNTITNGEYFFNTDPGFGKATAITISNQDSAIMQNFTANVAALQPGYHKLYGRFKDLYGNWGQTYRRSIEVIKSDTSYITIVEYFYGTDPGFGKAETFSFANPSTDSVYKFTIPYNKIPGGAARLYVRAQDNGNQNWSLTSTQTGLLVTTVKTGLWSDPATWSDNKIPDASTVVLLKHNVTVDINAICRSLATTGPSLNVNPGMLLNVTGK